MYNYSRKIKVRFGIFILVILGLCFIKPILRLCFIKPTKIFMGQTVFFSDQMRNVEELVLGCVLVFFFLFLFFHAKSRSTNNHWSGSTYTKFWAFSVVIWTTLWNFKKSQCWEKSVKNYEFLVYFWVVRFFKLRSAGLY